MLQALSKHLALSALETERIIGEARREVFVCSFEAKVRGVDRRGSHGRSSLLQAFIAP
jgi:hypothetical protein